MLQLSLSTKSVLIIFYTAICGYLSNRETCIMQVCGDELNPHGLVHPKELKASALCSYPLKLGI